MHAKWEYSFSSLPFHSFVLSLFSFFSMNSLFYISTCYLLQISMKLGETIEAPYFKPGYTTIGDCLLIFFNCCILFIFIPRGLFIAMVVSLLFLVLLRFIAGVLFWIFIFGVIGIIGYGKCQMLHTAT